MVNIKKHHIRFKEAPEGRPEEWESLLVKVKGVMDVKIDAAKGDVFIEYDLADCREEAIEHWMTENGFVLDDSFIERVKRGWVHYTEENEIDAINATPRSLSGIEEKED